MPLILVLLLVQGTYPFFADLLSSVKMFHGRGPKEQFLDRPFTDTDKKQIQDFGVGGLSEEERVSSREYWMIYIYPAFLLSYDLAPPPPPSPQPFPSISSTCDTRED
jgi:hypothetical protein